MMAASKTLLPSALHNCLSLPLVTTPRTLLICLLLLATSVPSFASVYEPNQNPSSGDAHLTRRCDECVENAVQYNKSISASEAQPSEQSNSTSSSDVKTAIDWNEVEENFHKVLSEDEVFHKWDTMEANMKSGLY